MDVTVSHLNNRLALQLPLEPPLGLVFVVGQVVELDQGVNGRSLQVQFALVEQAHRVRCVLSERAANEVTLREGMKIRAGGHLTFEPRFAGYSLLVRDVEVVQPPLAETLPSAASLDLLPDRAAMTAVLADIKKRSDAAQLAQADLPPWVQKIAPPEVKAEIPVPKSSEDQVDAEKQGVLSGKSTSAARPLSADMMARLSAAMDADDDVELTAEMLADLGLEETEEGGSDSFAKQPLDDPLPVDHRPELPYSPSAVHWEDPDAVSPPSRRNADYGMVLLLIIFAIVAVLLVIVIVTMLLP